MELTVRPCDISGVELGLRLRAITGRGSNMFLFVDLAKLAASNPLDVEWMSGKRKVVRLVD